MVVGITESLDCTFDENWSTPIFSIEANLVRWTCVPLAFNTEYIEMCGSDTIHDIFSGTAHRKRAFVDAFNFFFLFLFSVRHQRWKHRAAGFTKTENGWFLLYKLFQTIRNAKWTNEFEFDACNWNQLPFCFQIFCFFNFLDSLDIEEEKNLKGKWVL